MEGAGGSHSFEKPRQHTQRSSARRWIVTHLACFSGRAEGVSRPQQDPGRLVGGASHQENNSAAASSQAAVPAKHCLVSSTTSKATAECQCRQDINASFSLENKQQQQQSILNAASSLSQDLQSSGLHLYTSNTLASDSPFSESFAAAHASNHSYASCSQDAGQLQQFTQLQDQSDLEDCHQSWACQKLSAQQPNGVLKLAHRSLLDAEFGPGMGSKAASSPQLTSSRLRAGSVDLPHPAKDEEAALRLDRRTSLQLPAVTWFSSCDGVWRPHMATAASPFSPTSQQRQAAAAALSVRSSRYASIASQDRSMVRLREQMESFKKQQAAEIRKREVEAAAQTPGQPGADEDAWELDASGDQLTQWQDVAAAACPSFPSPGLTRIPEAGAGLAATRDAEEHLQGDSIPGTL